MVRVASSSALFFMVFIGFPAVFSEFTPLYKGYDWESKLIDLGNGGDGLFYYLIKCKICKQPAPLILWLTGGPGGSSSMGLLMQNGPYLFNMSYVFESNPYAWTQFGDVLYVDSPVATPMSIAKDQDHKCRNIHCVNQNLGIFLNKFIDLHPEYLGRDFYLTGTSYAGHYVPAFAAYLKKSGTAKVNVKGAAIGNGLMDLYKQIPSAPDFLYTEKLISLSQYIYTKAMTLVCRGNRDTFGYNDTDFACAHLIFQILGVVNVSSPYEVDRPPIPIKYFQEFIKLMNQKEYNEYFGWGGRTYDLENEDVYWQMWRDFPVSVLGDVAYLLEQGVKMIFYFGDKDYVCTWNGGLKAVDAINWAGAAKFKSATLVNWGENGTNYGLFKQEGKLTYIKVFNAGHSIFMRQPRASVKIIKDLLA